MPYLARPLRHGIGNNAIDSDDTEQECHGAGDGEHHQRERASRHRSAVNLFHGPDAGERKIRVDGPYSLPDFLDQAFGTRPGTTDCKNRASLHDGRLVINVLQHYGPIDTGRGLLVGPIIVDILYHADDLSPVVLHAFTDSFAERRRGVAPKLTRQVLRDQDHISFIVDVRPGVIASGDQTRSDGLEKARSDEMEAPDRREFRPPIRPVFSEESKSLLLLPSVGTQFANEAEATPGISEIFRCIFSSMLATRSGSFT